MNYDRDDRVVLTLDAGGTNLVFSAIQAEREIINPVRLPAFGNDIDKCLKTIIEGFSIISEQVQGDTAAISFAFPGPADYPRGIIGDLGNLPGFRGGVALGPMLEDNFSLPVFINNDGDLFALGESVAGLLPEINQKLLEVSSPRRYNNLIGVTLGTGFGCGIVRNNELFLGDNSAAGEIWLVRSKLHNSAYVEEDVSIRAVKRVYQKLSGSSDIPEPKEIYEIATGKKEGNREAALQAFKDLAVSVGDALANAVTLVDSIIVIGGGLTGASALIINDIVNEMNGTIETIDGRPVNRLVSRVYNLDDNENLKEFINGEHKEITVPVSGKKIIYDPIKRIGIGISRLGTNRSVAIGAYYYALQKLDTQ